MYLYSWHDSQKHLPDTISPTLEADTFWELVCFFIYCLLVPAILLISTERFKKNSDIKTAVLIFPAGTQASCPGQLPLMLSFNWLFRH